jgi:predicted anti-sigma-YlaC factor YlaD
VACEQLQAALSARLDGEHVALDRAVLDDHLERCQRCREFVEGAIRLRRRCMHAMSPIADRTEVILATVQRVDPPS